MFIKSIIIIPFLFLAACEQHIKPDYTPTSQIKTKGAVSLGEFKYSPAIVLKPNQVPVRYAKINLYLDKDVTDYFMSAVKSELEFSGITVAEDKTCKLKVVIDEFSVNNAGVSAKYAVKGTYTITDASERAVFEHYGDTNFKTYSPFRSHEQNLAEAARDNIQSFLSNPKFVETITSRCQN